MLCLNPILATSEFHFGASLKTPLRAFRVFHLAYIGMYWMIISAGCKYSVPHQYARIELKRINNL